MRRREIARMSRPARWLRGLRPDRNPLRRASDRAEAAIIAGLLIIFLAGAPLAALAAANWASAASPGTDARPAPHRVPAVLLAVLLLGTGRLVRWMLNRRRMAGWDADWQAAGPRWSGRR